MVNAEAMRASAADAAAINIGDVLVLDYRAPNITTEYPPSNLAIVVTDGSAPEVTGYPQDGMFNIDFGVDTIQFDYIFSAQWDSLSFNGPHISGLTDLADVALTTNMAGLTLANITFDATSLAINWQGLAFDRDTFVRLDLTGEQQIAPVPEPGTLALLGSGLVGAAVRARRRRAASARFGCLQAVDN